MLTTRRLSELADMLCMHLAFNRTDKALLIAQYLRRVTGSKHVYNLRVTGYRDRL